MERFLLFIPARFVWALFSGAHCTGMHQFVAPHIAGGSGVPADLVSAFIIASLATTGLFWLALGGISGAVYRRLA